MRRKKVGRPNTWANAQLTVHLTSPQYKKILGASLASNLSMTAVIRRIIDEWSGKQRRNCDIPEN